VVEFATGRGGELSHEDFERLIRVGIGGESRSRERSGTFSRRDWGECGRGRRKRG